MKKKLRLALTALLLLVFLVSAAMAVRQQLVYRENARSYAEAAQRARFQPPTGDADAPSGGEGGDGSSSGSGGGARWERADRPARDDLVRTALEGISMPALRAINPDIGGWIYIPDTEISYPLLCGEDNEYYLGHTWDKVNNSAGAIFVDCRCSPDLEDFHTIVYGHRMRNGSMFAGLKYYNDLDYWREHPAVYILDSSGVHVYDIFAAWEPSTSSILYTLDTATEEGRRALLDTCLASNQLDTGIAPELTDKILTLSTCTGNGHATRWVVQAVERRSEAS